MIVVDSSVWIDFFNGVSTPEVERLDGLLGVTPLAIGDLILVEVMQGFRSERDVATARQLFRSLALLPMLGVSNAWKAAENYRTAAPQGHHGAQDDRRDHRHCLHRGQPAAAVQRPRLCCPTWSTWGWSRPDQASGNSGGVEVSHTSPTPAARRRGITIHSPAGNSVEGR